jgi:mono/diheme cytochrome c family protein
MSMSRFIQRNSMRVVNRSAIGQTFIRERPESADVQGCARRALWCAAIAAAIMLTTGGSAPRAHSRTTQVTWTGDVEPIVAARCVRCHQPHGFAPMSLASYHDAKTWASAIRTEVLSARMPPWPAAPGYGDFSNDAHLSAVEMELLARWADGGAPLGSPAARTAVDAPPLRGASLHITLPSVTVAGTERRVALPLASDRNRWLSAWTFEPGDRSLVEEATLSVNDIAVGSWTAFDDRIVYPRQIADRIPRGAAVTLAVRYRKTSSAVVDRSAITLYFDRKPSRELRHVVAGCGPQAFNGDIDLLAVKPIAAAAGDTIEVVAFGSDEVVTPISVVSRYQPEYPVTYRLRTPVHLAKGSRVEIRSSAPGCSAQIDYVER